MCGYWKCEKMQIYIIIYIYNYTATNQEQKQTLPSFLQYFLFIFIHKYAQGIRSFKEIFKIFWLRNIMGSRWTTVKCVTQDINCQYPIWPPFCTCTLNRWWGVKERAISSKVNQIHFRLPSLGSCKVSNVYVCTHWPGKHHQSSK